MDPQEDNNPLPLADKSRGIVKIIQPDYWIVELNGIQYTNFSVALPKIRSIIMTPSYYGFYKKIPTSIDTIIDFIHSYKVFVNQQEDIEKSLVVYFCGGNPDFIE